MNDDAYSTPTCIIKFVDFLLETKENERREDLLRGKVGV
jgi:hypothetical protein